MRPICRGAGSVRSLCAKSDTTACPSIHQAQRRSLVADNLSKVIRNRHRLLLSGEVLVLVAIGLGIGRALTASWPLVVAIAIAFTILVVGVWFVYALYRAFSRKPRGPGDPGNSRLHQLAADPVFHALPPDAHTPETTLNPAEFRAPGFQRGGWAGPSVILTFQSTAAPQTIYGYYDEQARANDWVPHSTGALHITSTWRKTYSNGAESYLRIFTPRSWEAASGPRQYELSGSISLPRQTR